MSANLGQNVYYSPTVFNYFLPGYQIDVTGSKPEKTVPGPEFELMSEATATATADTVYSLIYGKPTGATIDLTPYTAILGAKPGATEIGKLLDALNAALMGGRMPAAMKSTIATAVAAQTTPTAMAETAVYLIASSWDFQVER